jgi:hypothetical protein
MKNTSLVITSIANDSHPVLKQYAVDTEKHNVSFIVIGDTKSPAQFYIEGCDFYSIERQSTLGFSLAKNLPTKHYARKNIGYLVAIKAGAEVIIETDDDNIPMDSFWTPRVLRQQARAVKTDDWVNVYEYFTESHIWPRGFNLAKILDPLPALGGLGEVYSPIQQGLADDNPDVDAIYRLTLPLPIKFEHRANIALGLNSVCPFNSQNTTWFKEAFPLLYLPSYCSFRMTDIWRSFIAQRIGWTCGWSILFHGSTVRQERNDHSLMKDFEEEISGYVHNAKIVSALRALSLKKGVEHIPDNLTRCYQELVDIGVIGKDETRLVQAWLSDLSAFEHI